MQGILGTSLNNPIFYLTRDQDDETNENFIHIFYGFQKFIKIPDDKNSLLFRSTIAMLVNVGITKKHIQENFNIAFETIQKTSEIFSNAKDDNDLINQFKWPGRTNKVNEEVFDYIHERAKHHKLNKVHRYIKAVIKDVYEKFNIELSREKVRLELNKKYFNDKKEKEEIITKDQKIIKFDDEQVIYFKDVEILPPENNIPTVFRNQYAGLLLLSFQLSIVFKDFPAIKTMDNVYSLKSIFVWWILGVLLKGKNLERFRYFNIKDFEFISGFSGLPSVEKMREILHELSLVKDTTASTFILKKNVDYFVEKDNTYYIDPHFEEYTGKSEILKGWNTKKNRVCKGNFDNFVHDGCGNPLFSLLMDNFYDFREIIIKILDKIKKLRPKEPITLIYDRGGFSTDLMEQIASEPDQYFITWQKGFKQQDAESIIFNGKVSIEYPYNDLGKFKTVKYILAEDIWECKNFKCRRIVFRKEYENPDGFCQSILTNKSEMEAGLVLQKMLKRSLQENDFKKQGAHHGINEITSYKKISYGKLGDKNPDKMITNDKYKNKLKEIQNLNAEKNKLIKKIGLKVYKSLQGKKEPSNLKSRHKETLKKINQINLQIKEKKEEKTNIPKEVSKLEKYKNENKFELDLRPKRILGLLKMTSRNILENGAKDFLETYRNLRDYQKVFRKLIRTGAEIRLYDKVMLVKLDSFGRPKFKEKCNKYFKKFNERKIYTMDGKYILRFALFD